MANWLLYGASGHSGQLIAEEAIRRGHRPILAGRSAAKLKPLAERLSLEQRVFDLQDRAAVRAGLAGVALVCHAAGPFIHTSAPMVAACLQRGVNYVDITGEVAVFEQTLALGTEARAAGVCVMSGVGFDVVPTDCLARHVAEQVPEATELEIAVAATGGFSAGTLKTALEHLDRGALVRRDGQLQALRLGAGARRLRFPDRSRSALIAAWGDLATAYRTTGIPNITTYLCFPRNFVNQLQWAGPLAQAAFRNRLLHRLVQGWVTHNVRGPDEQTRESGRGYAWARAASPQADSARGDSVEAWLIVPETYTFTALAAVRCIERILADRPRGALTPALAFGTDFVLTLPGVRRLDRLD
jgi:short subunit dehydrogenase-like uncharacterized protein